MDRLQEPVLPGRHLLDHPRLDRRTWRGRRHSFQRRPLHSAPHNAEMYKWRHLVESFFRKIKAFRRIATRHDKTDISLAAAIHLVATVLATQ